MDFFSRLWLKAGMCPHIGPCEHFQKRRTHTDGLSAEAADAAVIGETPRFAQLQIPVKLLIHS